MKYKLVMFDFDGTLADSFPWVMSMANDIVSRYHLKQIGQDEMEAFRYSSVGQIIKRLKIPVWKLPLMVRRFRTVMAQQIVQIKLFDGMGQVITDLSRQGCILAVVSSNSTANVRQVLGSENANRIKYYECGVSLFGKSARIRKVLWQSRIKRDQAILIGDEIRDGEAARKTGIAFGAVGWGYTSVEALRVESPGEIFQQPFDILQALSVD